MKRIIFPKELNLPDTANFPATGKPVGKLQSALLKLKLEVDSSELARKEMGASTDKAIRTFQTSVGLPADGKLNTDTIAKLKAELVHGFVAQSKTRTQRLQTLLLEVGYKLNPEEIKNRSFGPSTEQALKEFQTKTGVQPDGHITENIVNKIRENALQVKLHSKTQVMQVQRVLLRALNIAKLKDIRIDADELKNRKIGPSTQSAITAVQTKYGLPVTGELDTATYDRLISIATSIPEPARRLKIKSTAELRPLKKVARLNMKGNHIGNVQSILAFLGFEINESEYKTKKFGKSTHDAVVSYQKAHGLAITGHVSDDTLKSLNRDVQRVNPSVISTEFPYRIRGSVRNDRWQGVTGATVQIWENLIGVQGTMLTQLKTGENGFFDIIYNPPRDASTKQIKQSFRLQIKVIDASGNEIGSKQLFNPKQIAWVNFTQGNQPYRGTSEYKTRMMAVSKVISSVEVGDLVETPGEWQISQAAQAAGISTEDVMRLVLAHLVASELNTSPLGAEVCYAYIAQNLPPFLPQEDEEDEYWSDDLNFYLNDWTKVSDLVKDIASGLAFMEDGLKVGAFNNAITLNLMPIDIILQKDNIIEAFSQLKRAYILEKPILIGNGSLKQLFILSGDNINNTAVLNLFLEHKNFGPDFWGDVNKHPDKFGGFDAIKNFKDTVEVGHITTNFEPMLKLIKGKIAEPQVENINSARDLAKLSLDDWMDLIKDSGGIMPPDIVGDDKVKTYGSTLMSRSEQLHPSVTLVETIKRKAATVPNYPLSHVSEIQTFLDEYIDFDLKKDNLDSFVQNKGLKIDETVLTEGRVIQRVHRIAPTALAGQALLENNIHSSFQIVAMGKEQFAENLMKNDLIDRRMAMTVFAYAEHQYAEVLQKIADFRFELHSADPKAMIDYMFTKEELPPEFAAIPNLETLFGSLDFCECPHCQSVYGPAAYLADVLRFLDKHPSELGNKTVKEILFERRPDIGNIKLNCENTETPLPYIDLVCEVLENAIVMTGPDPNFKFQTTHTAAELRAAPEHVQEDAYVTLRSAEFPLNIAFDLWQEQARVFLQHLGVARWELMEAFQPLSHAATSIPAPDNISIAGEYWGMSTKETGIVITKTGNTKKLKIYWGFKSAKIPSELSVEDFMHRSFLNYEQVLELCDVRWINPLNGPKYIEIERPYGTCDTKLQKLINLNADRFDKIHRFLRLWRHVGWEMWELDMLIRSEAIGKSSIDGGCLVRMKQFEQLMKKLGLSVERTLALFMDINTEVRVKQDGSKTPIPSLYENLFLNPAVNPANKAFILPIVGALPLSEQKSAILAAFAMTEADFTLLQKKFGNDKLSITNLSKINRYVTLAQGLAMQVKDILTFESLYSVPDIFASPKDLMDFIEALDWVKQSFLTVDQLDYLLTLNPDSPIGPREEVITQQINTLYEALRATAVSKPENVIASQVTTRYENAIASQVATIFALPPKQAQLLLRQLKLGTKTLLDLLMELQFVKQNDKGEFDPDTIPKNFADIYNAFRILHKASILVLAFKLESEELEWLFANVGKFNLLDLGMLPVTDASKVPLFPKWLELAKLKHFQGIYPEPEGMSLRMIFDSADIQTSSVDKIKENLAKLTQWTTNELDDVVTTLSLQHGGAVSDFAKIDNYLQMEKCVRYERRIGVSVAILSAWARRDDDTDDMQKTVAQQVRQAAKSKYDYAVWLDKVAPLENALREKKRDALIGYLVAKSLLAETPTFEQDGKKYDNPDYWQDANDLLKHFLIDVEMSACQLTSRIKQAISSTQMFVQRCLLGMEQPWVEVSRAEQKDTVSDNSWKQWKWMKNYRIWEANRKVFLYPENWIEPELRDDKSPFFKELENEIQQSDMTEENAETAFLNYVQKVHEVSRLDIVGTYYELDDTDPCDNLPDPDINLMHVIGRTKAQPAVYYYRKYDLNYGEWTAWEKIDLDIQSNQVIPVVYNRHLYLFWLNFIEKPQKVKKLPPAKPDDKVGNTPEPPSQLEIQLCWSVQKDNGWTTKKVSHQKMIHPWQRPLYSYNLKPRYKRRENLLWLDVYISQSQAFNSTTFWDAYRSVSDYVTKNHPFSETARPWHSSSFVFDGDVVDVKMKALYGKYHTLNKYGVADDHLTETTSHNYVHDNFGAAGTAITALSGPYEIAPRLPLPDGMHYNNTKLTNNKANASNANVLENGHTRTLLSGAKSPFEIVVSQHNIVFDTAAWGQVPFFYQDNTRAFFIKPEWKRVIGYDNTRLQFYNYTFFPFYHPYTALFIRELNRSGIGGLLNRRIQTTPQSYYPGNSFDFNSYSPGSMIVPDKTTKNECVDFERYGAYALYNWEIFFHAPLMIACRLSQNQRFEEAMRWFHYIFDPTNTESPDIPQRYWITKPFFDQNSDEYRKQRIDNLLKNIEQHEDELRAWKNNPFKPHLIARYRPVAYQKTVVMKYIDNLIAWGDQLFRRDTIESINEATTLYALAYELLGRRPIKVTNVEHDDKSYNELAIGDGLDPFGNKQVDVLMENFTSAPMHVTRKQIGTEPLPTLKVFYFGIPNNNELLEYWNTVEDRLFKIRHCMNIQGIVRQLPLFEPPIDPALLVKAAAAGVDLDSVLSDMGAAASPYRFRQMAQKALEFCSEVKALGDKLLTVMEKYDAEGLSLLRSTQEIELHQAVREIRKQQIKEANESWASLERSKELAQQKKDFYESREFMNAWEITALSLGGISALAQTAIASGYSLAGGLALIPRFSAGVSGFGGSPKSEVDPVDGKRISMAAEQAVRTLEAISSATDKLGSLASTVGSYTRRKEDWDLQGQLATTEVAQIEKQIIAAQIRLAISEKELENQELQIEHSQTVDDYMRSKYTNQQLYDWQVKQVASVYFKSYQLAYDMAKRAEKSFQYELGNPKASFVQFGYWDSLKKGILAGEFLANDIHRMEVAYLEQSKRNLEITKHISLAQLCPLSLLVLKEAGACSVELPEWLFDMDYPGHYQRRLKSVSISIPCVTGPYTSINCTLTLTKNGIRMEEGAEGGYGDPLTSNDTRFNGYVASMSSIATSNGQNDAGMFELNFNDERFLPFEGAGAVSKWRIDLPIENNQFDFATISDVILHVRYTAKESGNTKLIAAAKDNLTKILPEKGIRMFVLNQEFSSEWYHFLHPTVGQDQTLSFTLGLEHLPFYARVKKDIKLAKVDIIAEGTKDVNYSVELTPPGVDSSIETMAPDSEYKGRQHMEKTFTSNSQVLGNWQMKINGFGSGNKIRPLAPDELKNIYFILGFKN